MGPTYGRIQFLNQSNSLGMQNQEDTMRKSTKFYGFLQGSTKFCYFGEASIDFAYQYPVTTSVLH